MKDGTVVKIVAIVCVTAPISIALFKGVDGAFLALGIAAIAGLGGYTLRMIQGD